MKITTIKPKKNHESPYTMVDVSPKEACALIQSLSRQVGERNSNTGRLETFVPGFGYFSISVQEDVHCLECGKEVEPWTGKQEKQGIICSIHKTHQERGELTFQKKIKGFKKFK